MAERNVRIGIVGAGANTRSRHIPGFKAISGVEVVSVCNRSRESSERVAKELGIARVYDRWTDLVDADDTDAICIGTWPYLHCPVTLRVLERGKHVLTEARMAMDAAEARAMLEESRLHPELVAQVVPAPYTLPVDRTVQDLIAEGFLGQVLTVDIRFNQESFADYQAPLHWRQDRDLSGFNVLAMGIVYESMMRWVGPASRVLALTRTFVPGRKDTSGRPRAVEVPDHVDALCDLVCGAQARLQFSAVTGLAPRPEAWLFGSQGTVRVEVMDGKVWGARRGEKQLQPIPIQQGKAGHWRVEEEFVNAIRGKEPVTHTTFEDGVKYMEFTEAVARSAQSGAAVSLPL